MQEYKNLSGNSGVRAFDIGKGFIEVLFSSGWIYKYTDEVTGASEVKKLEALALSGSGLGTYIRRNVGKRYALKRR